MSFSCCRDFLKKIPHTPSCCAACLSGTHPNFREVEDKEHASITGFCKCIVSMGLRVRGSQNSWYILYLTAQFLEPQGDSDWYVTKTTWSVACEPSTSVCTSHCNSKCTNIPMLSSLQSFSLLPSRTEDGKCHAPSCQKAILSGTVASSRASMS